MQQKLQDNQSGFSLIEIMVAVSIFSIVMLISMGSILSVLDANKKSQTLRAVMDNLNSTMESMIRSIRFGKNYHCGTIGDINDPMDCPSGDSSLTVLSPNGRITYKSDSGRIFRSIGVVDSPITSPDVTISKLTFYVLGSAPYISGDGQCTPSNNDCLQPRVIIVISGSSGTKPNSKSKFTLETTVSQRQFDFK